MSGRRQGLLACTIPLLFCSLFFLPPGLAAQESCQSAQCHATLVQGTAVHEAAESCDTCHAATATPHPQPGTATFKLTDAEPAMCTGCHDALGAKAQVHAPFADGRCTN